MKFNIKCDSYPMGGGKDRLLPPIPGTTQTIQLNTDQGIGRQIWEGYVEMNPKVVLTIDTMRTALNEFYTFMAGGGGSDHWSQVTKIEVIDK